MSFLCQSHNFTRDLMENWWGFLSLPTLQYPEYTSSGFHSSDQQRFFCVLMYKSCLYSENRWPLSNYSEIFLNNLQPLTKGLKG